MCKSRKGSKFMSGTQACQNSEIVSRKATRQIGNLPYLNPLLSTVGECVAHKAIQPPFPTAMRSLTGNSDQGIEETSAPFEARSAPVPHPTPTSGTRTY